MVWRNVTLIVRLMAAFVAGVAIGYAAKPSIDVRLCEPAQLGSVRPMFDASNPTLKELTESPVIGPVVSAIQNWQPVGRIGPFVIHVNKQSRGYLIAENDGRGAALMQETASGCTQLSLLGKCQEIWLTLTYDETSGQRIRSAFQANAAGGLLAPTRWVYYDDDGDGRFDTMVDCENGVAYEQRGLQWVEIRAHPRNRTATREDTNPNGTSGRPERGASSAVPRSLRTPVA